MPPTTTAPPRRNFLTVAEVLDELRVPASTWNDWRAKKKGPRVRKLPNGELRVDRADLDTWLDSLPS